MLSFFKRLAGQVPTPKPDHVTLFVDDTGVPAYKDEADVAHTLQGGPGDKGDTGDKGDPGLSAYQVWLAAGNVGTEADYLASLKGVKGDPGDTGAGVPTGGATDAILAKSAAGNFLTKWIAKATTSLAQAGTDNNSWMTPSLTLAEIIALTGWGGGTQKIADDCNTIDSSRILRTTGVTLNLPAGMATDGILLNMRSAADQLIQVWSTVREIGTVNRPALFVRGYYGAAQTWGPWRRMADDATVVHNTGNEVVSGVKEYQNPAGVCARYNIGTQGQVEFGYPTGLPGIIFRNGDPASPATAWRSDFRQGTEGRLDVVVNNIAGDNTSAARGMSFRLTDIRPTSNGLLSLGVDGAAWSNMVTQALLVSKGAGDTAVTITSGTNAGAQAQCYFNTPQKNVIMQVSTSGRAGFWDASNSRWIWFGELAPGSIKFNGSLQPETTNSYSLGSASLLWTTVYATNATINTSDKRYKKGFRKLSGAEISAFTEIQELDWVWEWIEGGDRLHSGPTVQDVARIMEEHGLDPWAYSFMCYDKIDPIPEITVDVPAWSEEIVEEVFDEETGETHEVTRVEDHEAYSYVSQDAQPGVDRYGMRKEELNLWLNAANHARLKAIEARLA